MAKEVALPGRQYLGSHKVMVGTALHAVAALSDLNPRALPPVTKILASSQMLFALNLRYLKRLIKKIQ